MYFETLDDKLSAKGAYKSVAGTPTLDQYEYQVDKSGHKSLVLTDRKENVHARIQADADSCDINKLMARFAMGDSTALDQKAAFYIDATKLPESYADLFNRVEACKQFFDGLPVDLKQLFDNSYEVYFAEFGSKDFSEKYAKYNSRFENDQFKAEETVPEDIPKINNQFVEVER